MSQLRRRLHKTSTKVIVGACVAVGLGSATWFLVPPPDFGRWFAAAILGLVFFTLSVGVLDTASDPRPVEPFQQGEIGLIVDSDRAGNIANRIRTLAGRLPLASLLKFRTADAPLDRPADAEARKQLRERLKARFLLREAGRDELRFIVLDGPGLQSKSAPFFFYAELYDWVLSLRKGADVSRFVLAYILYWKEFYEEAMSLIASLPPHPEVEFLRGCAALRMVEKGGPPLAAIGHLEDAARQWDRRLYSDLWSRCMHNLGIAHLNVDPVKAAECLSAALELRRRETYPSGWAYTANNLALALHKMGQRGKAADLLRDARDTLAKAEYAAGAEAVARNLAQLEPSVPSVSSLPAEVEAARIQIRELIGIPEDPFSRPGIRIAHRLVQATSVSADFYKIIPRQDGSVGVTLVDVEGHGLGASTTAVAIDKALFRPGANWGAGDPREQLLAADDLVSEELGYTAVAVTMNFLEVDPYTKRVRYAGAGMPFPLLFRYGQAQPETLTAVGMYVGDGYRRMHVNPDRAEAQAGDGDLVLMFTDGIPEARDSRGRVFGTNGIIAAVLAIGLDSPEAVADAVLAAALHHAGRDRPEDDQAILVIQIGNPLPAQPLEEYPVLQQLAAGPSAVAFELVNVRGLNRHMDVLRTALMSWAARHLPHERCQAAWSALVEAIQNALRHSSGPGEAIRIDFKPAPPGIEIVVRQPKRWLNWDLSLGSRRPTRDLVPEGVGTLTMLRVADDVWVTDQGRRVHLKFASRPVQVHNENDDRDQR